MDWLWWISEANSKGEAAWRKSYVVCMEESQWYYLFWVFKPWALNAELYSQQLKRVHENLFRKRPVLVSWRKVVFLLNNTDSFSKNHAEKILYLDWFVLPHPLYSPDLELSDFHIFCPLQNALNDIFFSRRSGENVCGNLSSKPAKFCLK